MCELLRNKGLEDSINRDSKPSFMYKDVKSAVEGLIKYHEDVIESLIEIMKMKFIKSRCNYKLTSDNTKVYTGIQGTLASLHREYSAINAIELWLEDVI